MPGLLHHLYDSVEVNGVFSVGECGIQIGIESSRGGVCVSLDAGYLHKAAYGVAGESEVVLESHFGGVLNLCGCAAEQL